jgi:hypothetical protein
LKTESANSPGYLTTQGRDNQERVPPIQALRVCFESRGEISSCSSITTTRLTDAIGRRRGKFPVGNLSRDFRSSRRSQCVSCWRVNLTRNLDSVRAPADSVDGERETRFLMRSRISRSLGPGFQGANFGKASIQNGSLGGVHLSLAVHCLVASYQAS